MNVFLINYNTHCRRKQLFFRGKKDSFLKIPHSGIILYDMKTLILNKALKIFEVLTQAENPLTLKEICRRTGITPPAASRLLSDLAEGGYVHKVSYREFEPGLGMIYLGQGSLRHNFFPQNATQFLQSELRRMGIGGALAGMFNDHLVYLYHSLHEHGHRISTLPLPDQRLSGSNIALVILCVRYGPERAREVLCSELRANCTGIELERRENSVLRRGRALEHLLPACGRYAGVRSFLSRRERGAGDSAAAVFGLFRRCGEDAQDLFRSFRLIRTVDSSGFSIQKLEWKGNRL